MANLLRRLGNKSKIAETIIQYFPPHKLYIEPFFGAGGMFFSKPKATYNIVNDLDADVYNLFWVLMNKKEELINEFKNIPVHSDLIEYWKTHQEQSDIKKAIRFLHLSNFTFLGKGEMLKLTAYNNAKQIVEQSFESTFEKLKDVQFVNYDFRKFLNSISFNKERPLELENTFVYLDPPYLGVNRYTHKFKKTDSIDLLDLAQSKPWKFAMSEFNSDFIIDQAKQRNLNVIYIGERRNIGNRRTEILITNYSLNQLEFNFNIYE